MKMPDSYLNTKINGLRIIVVGLFFLFLALVAYTHYRGGWTAIIELKKIDTSCNKKGQCKQTIYLNEFGGQLEIGDGVILAPGDIVQVSYACTMSGCRPLSLKPLKVQGRK